eukprot:CAMPEP_0202772226 /NCGR_PEP_ID=MMETSP1388-20130828/42242_1 /ASSEMBLY_ACC=CAM_ASM_000864 /TAXON_ID=37098 /ORGANISM="Isochrysis sp, Strain CCMP1244" /LENGTH=92 /DNA_ID=CAMNT_0049441193 /DNA_START=49 /DNA_END=323 /DNA_ORIENTATION=+
MSPPPPPLAPPLAPPSPSSAAPSVTSSVASTANRSAKRQLWALHSVPAPARVRVCGDARAAPALAPPLLCVEKFTGPVLPAGGRRLLPRRDG